MKTLILALGNPILSDDGVAHKIADRIQEHLEDASGASENQYEIIKSSAATMDIIPKLAGYDRLVVIDAIQLGDVPVGTVHKLHLDDFASTIRRSSPHDINFATALQMGKELGYHLPADVRIYGIEVQELSRFSEDLSPQVAEKLPEIAEDILRDLFPRQ